MILKHLSLLLLSATIASAMEGNNDNNFKNRDFTPLKRKDREVEEEGEIKNVEQHHILTETSKKQKRKEFLKGKTLSNFTDINILHFDKKDIKILIKNTIEEIQEQAEASYTNLGIWLEANDKENYPVQEQFLTIAINAGLKSAVKEHINLIEQQITEKTQNLRMESIQLENLIEEKEHLRELQEDDSNEDSSKNHATSLLHEEDENGEDSNEDENSSSSSNSSSIEGNENNNKEDKKDDE